MGRCYPHLNLEERRKLAKWLDAKIPIKEIADNLARAPSTVFREIKRNYYRDDELLQLNGYHAVVAQDAYEERRAVHLKLIRYPDIMAAVRSGFDAGWSPEQIAGRMRLERHPMRVSHETIYRYTYSKDGRAEKFYRHLPEHRRRRRPRGTRRHVSTIFRELKRNHFSDESMPGCDGYYGHAAHLRMERRRSRQRKLIKHNI